MTEKKRVLMICLGNLCRSPIAEAVFNDQINKLGLSDSWEVDSAAIIGYHIGKNPDHRSMSIIKEKGITNYSHKARQITRDDFIKFDWILAMDNSNIQYLNTMKPPNTTAKIELLGKYDPRGELTIRDPYYDVDIAGFYKVYEQCLRSSKAFLEKHKRNSCRSPIAEAIFYDEIKKLNLLNSWEVDSAALLKYHVGNNPEPRAMSTLKKRGIVYYTHTARQITKEDFYKFNWIFGMDNRIVYDLFQMQPEDSQAKIELLGKYDPNGELNIQDPLFDNDCVGFEKAFEQAARSIKIFLNQHKDIYL